MVCKEASKLLAKSLETYHYRTPRCGVSRILVYHFAAPSAKACAGVMVDISQNTEIIHDS
jgi:hypothetical protein